MRAALVFCTVLLCLLWLPDSDASCANMCSGHGTCGMSNKCTCDAQWNVVPDCSRHVCPSGVAWVDKASAPNGAHATVMECSNRGICDYSKGSCICAEGYTGDACQRMRCPNDCSGRGQCLTLSTLARLYGPQTPATGLGPIYTNWEKDSIMSCYCDMGFTGPDCSMRMCPKNDDPLTTSQVYRSIALTVSASSLALVGTVSVTFNGYSFTMPANANANSDAICTAAAMTLGNVRVATCVMSAVNAATQGATYTIEFQEWAHRDAENNVFSHTGNPPVASFSCNVAGVTNAKSPTCSIADVVSVNVIEHEYCSRRGICDFTTGLCTCFLDYKTSDCSQLSNIPDNIDDHDGFLIQPIGPSYVGTALHIHTIKAMATDFQMIKIEAATQAIFYMLGNGDTFWTKGNVRVDSGTLFVQAGETIATGGLLVQDGGSTTTLSTVAGTVSDSLASNTGFTGTVMTVRATQPAAMSFYLFTASTANSNVAMFDIRGDGRTTVHSGGLEVVLGGATITDNAVATSVLTIQASNVAYTGTVVTVAATMGSLFPATDFNLLTASAGGTTAVTVEASGKTTLANGGLYVNGIGGGNFVNQDPLAPALTALSGLGTFLGTVATLEATRAASTAFKLLEAKSNGVVTFSVRGDGFTTVHSGGFQVLLGGGTITAGGFFVNAGGATVNAGGLMVTSGGATVQAQGLVVVDGGADITSTAQLLPSLAVHASHVAFQDSVAVIETTVVAAASSFYLLKMRTSTTTAIFDVRGDGVTTIHQGGLVVTTGGKCGV
ncbi:hypothetical protein H310_02049 [Aphanomyces invadans]|uniref:EGF-like domain-containing protein n=1 Tax=Aphanomyces invadans TaxID=157072 RepID=A0A024UNZ1_9STRA|nr:hypothetical protein H310_02049 [Aphanomyces invadans]ETW07562.1 hypothetical protein H310_02049 [Aphanomyces invadans]|eukprot:XP_008863655.1 hypothetical protein H310_02049 [Aphanomyces invadans]